MKLVKHGFALMPLMPSDKRPYFDMLRMNGKGQPSWKPYVERPPTEEEVKSWFTYDPSCNYGILTGKASGGLYVLDVDNVDKLPQTVELPRTVTVKTGRGFHYYFRYSKCLKGCKFCFGELKGEGGYVVGPGSIHRNGNLYTCYDLRNIDEIEIETVPEWILDEYYSQNAKPFIPYDALHYEINTKDLIISNGARKNSITKDRARKNTFTCSIGFKELSRLNEKPEIAFKIIALCGREVSEIGKAFICPLPGHNELRPSASLYQEDKKAIVLNDFHEKGGKGRFSWPLVDVYASCKTGKTLSLGKGERAIWWLRALHEIGEIELPIIDHIKLPVETKNHIKKIFEGFIYLVQLRQFYEPNNAVPFSWRFASRWCGIKSMKQVASAMKWLLQHGYLIIIEKGKSIDETGGCRATLFALGKTKK